MYTYEATGSGLYVFLFQEDRPTRRHGRRSSRSLRGTGQALSQPAAPPRWRSWLSPVPHRAFPARCLRRWARRSSRRQSAPDGKRPEPSGDGHHAAWARGSQDGPRFVSRREAPASRWGSCKLPKNYGPKNYGDTLLIFCAPSHAELAGPPSAGRKGLAGDEDLAAVLFAPFLGDAELVLDGLGGRDAEDGVDLPCSRREAPASRRESEAKSKRELAGVPSRRGTFATRRQEEQAGACKRPIAKQELRDEERLTPAPVPHRLSHLQRIRPASMLHGRGNAIRRRRSPELARETRERDAKKQPRKGASPRIPRMTRMGEEGMRVETK